MHNIIYLVQALKEIGKTVGKRNWDFDVDPCSGQRNWTSAVQVKGSENAVTCDCSFANNTVCHVISMYVNILSLSLFLYYLLTLSKASLFSKFCAILHIISKSISYYKIYDIILFDFKFKIYSNLLIKFSL